MRRATASAVALAVLLALAGCAEAGVDGDLTDDWPALGELRPFLPVAGVCHPTESPREVSAAQSSVDCAVPHLGETVHVGAFPAGVAKLPPEQAAESRAAFAECDRRAAGYVGAQWRSARLRLDVAVPTGTAWARGARWFRCDLTEVTGVEQESPAPVLRTGSLRNALTTGGPLLLGCYTAALSRVGLVEKLTPVDCARGHNAEFAGVWPVPERLDRPRRDRDWLPFYEACSRIIAAYVGVPDDGLLPARAGIKPVPTSAARWRAGDRAARCYFWLPQRQVQSSLRGGGPDALPVPGR